MPEMNLFTAHNEGELVSACIGCDRLLELVPA